MEILQKNLLNIIHEKCSSGWQLEVFRDHVIINLPDNEKDFRSAYSKAKKQISVCVQLHFPERNADILFEVRNSAWNCGFKLGKTVT